MSPTEAQIRARKKYREKQEYLQTRISPEEKLVIAEHVNTTNESLSNFIRRAITETMERDKVTGQIDNNNPWGFKNLRGYCFGYLSFSNSSKAASIASSRVE